MPSIIRPTDLAQFESTARTLGLWDPATLKRLVPFLAGEEVIVVVQERTGHAVRGRITGIQDHTRNSDYPHLAIQDKHGTTLYPVSTLGDIVILGESAARWHAFTAVTDETITALSAVRAFIGTDFPAGAPYKGTRKWTTTLTWSGVTVAWGESFRDRRWYVDHDGNVTTP